MTTCNSTSADLVIAHYVPAFLVTDPINSPVWAQIPSARISHYWSGEPAPIKRHAAAQVCWTDLDLIVRFVCLQHEPLIVSSKAVTHRKTLFLWERDVCEIFIAPDPQRPSRYFEFEAAPTGEWVDLAIVASATGRETDWDFMSGMTAAAEIGLDQVTIVMRIPWGSEIPKPLPGDEWRVNLFRCVGPEAESRYLAWRPTRTPEPNFHVPEVFGWLRFG